jgi:hypothetical protein
MNTNTNSNINSLPRYTNKIGLSSEKDPEQSLTVEKMKAKMIRKIREKLYQKQKKADA